MLTVKPMTLADANRFVAEHHRHHKPVRGHKFSLGCMANGRLAGVAIVGRPVSRYLDDGLTLEDECLKSGTLPSIAYGFKRCSLKHKIGPQEKFCNNHPPCREVWNSGKKVVKFIGYDAGEHYRSDKVLLRDLADPKYSKWYPLMEWGWDREACVRAIEAAGLPQPGKSSCFFCPSMRAEEIIDLRERYPDLFRRALALEDNARANLKTVRGLGRNYSWKERFGKEQCNHGND